MGGKSIPIHVSWETRAAKTENCLKWLKAHGIGCYLYWAFHSSKGNPSLSKIPKPLQ